MPRIVPGMAFTARVSGVREYPTGYRWRGLLQVDKGGKKILLDMPGNIARWLVPGETVLITPSTTPVEVDSRTLFFPRDSYTLDRMVGGRGSESRVRIWPSWSKRYTMTRKSWSGRASYEYTVVAREAVTQEDYENILTLEQYHYASKEEKVGIWKCPVCGHYEEANTRPRCPNDGTPMVLQEIRGSLPSSRFMVLELITRREYEPRYVAYVRVDTPIPLMSRRLVVDGRVEIEPMVREKVFGTDWFHPTFWPIEKEQKMQLFRKYREILKRYRSRSIARALVGEENYRTLLSRVDNLAARIARVVVHPDYRGDGLGVLSVKAALEWIRDARVPEMKRKKKVVETIAQMARFNPFFEKVGFKYLWDTASGRPVLFYPLDGEAEEKIRFFLENDPHARLHGGRLYRPHLPEIEPLEGPIRVEGLTKHYESTLDLEGLPTLVQEVLRAFGVEKRTVTKMVLEDASFEIEPREVVVLVGISGAGKTTLLRLIYGSTGAVNAEPDQGRISLPPNTRASALIPGEAEPVFGDETLLEHMLGKLGDVYSSLELLNSVGLSDAVMYRARFDQLSTGQKERAKLASILAERPNLLLIDEFLAHLDPLTAMRVARKLGILVRKLGITLVASTHRREILQALEPDSIIYTGYGKAVKVPYRGQEV